MLRANELGFRSHIRFSTEITRSRPMAPERLSPASFACRQAERLDGYDRGRLTLWLERIRNPNKFIVQFQSAPSCHHCPIG